MFFGEKILDILDTLVTILEEAQKKNKRKSMCLPYYLEEFATIKLHLPRQIGKTHALLRLAKTRFAEDCIILSENNRARKNLIDRCKELEYKELEHNIFSIKNLESLKGLDHKEAILIDAYNYKSINMQRIYEKTVHMFKKEPYLYIIVS